MMAMMKYGIGYGSSDDKVDDAVWQHKRFHTNIYHLDHFISCWVKSTWTRENGLTGSSPMQPGK